MGGLYRGSGGSRGGIFEKQVGCRSWHNWPIFR